MQRQNALDTMQAALNNLAQITQYLYNLSELIEEYKDGIEENIKHLEKIEQALEYDTIRD